MTFHPNLGMQSSLKDLTNIMSDESTEWPLYKAFDFEAFFRYDVNVISLFLLVRDNFTSRFQNLNCTFL